MYFQFMHKTSLCTDICRTSSAFVSLPCISFSNMFSLDSCWNGTDRHYSCQHSVSLPLLKSFTVNQTFFIIVFNVVRGKIRCRDGRICHSSFLTPCLYSHLSHIRLRFLFNTPRKVKSNHCDTCVSWLWFHL